jgi:hypothetical protein
MAKYADTKRETLSFIDYYSHEHDVRAGYLQPPEKPLFNAATALDDVGMNRNMRKGLAKAANFKMPKALGGTWNKVSVLEMAGASTIGELILLFSACSLTPVPDGEPT